jgi:dTDP-4-dehydrorhamnose reductase
MRILVFGKDGQLGKAFQKLFLELAKQKGDLVINCVGRAECDLANAGAITNLLKQAEPDLIINAAAYTAVDKAVSEPELANAINAIAPKIIARYAAEYGATFLHFSTDYVFDGTKSGFYLEDDPSNPLSQYGKSKAAGERAIEEVFESAPTGQYAILRTSWVYGDGGNFIKTILRLAKERDTLAVVQDQRGVPTSADWLAAISLNFVLDSRVQLRKIASGIYHAVPAGETNWYELARLAISVALEAGVSLKIDPANIKPIAASEYQLPAPRPMNSRMSTEKMKRAIDDQADVSKSQHWNESWSEQVRSYIQDSIKKSAI